MTQKNERKNQTDKKMYASNSVNKHQQSTLYSWLSAYLSHSSPVNIRSKNCIPSYDAELISELVPALNVILFLIRFM